MIQKDQEPGGLPGSFCLMREETSRQIYGTLVWMTSCGQFAAASRLAKLMFDVEEVVTATLKTPVPVTSEVRSVLTQVLELNAPDVLITELKPGALL